MQLTSVSEMDATHLWRAHPELGGNDPKPDSCFGGWEDGRYTMMCSHASACGASAASKCDFTHLWFGRLDAKHSSECGHGGLARKASS